MRTTRQHKRLGTRARQVASDEGIEFVSCRICGDHRRVISGRHLSKHDIDRETYMAEYGLSPDELIAKGFRMIRSSRRGYFPYGKRDWAAAINRVYKTDGNVFAKYLQDNYPHIYQQGIWIFGDWDEALRAAGFNPKTMRKRRVWDKEKLAKEIQVVQDRNQPLNAKYAMKNHGELFSAAQRRFGSWSKALVAAGVSKKEPPKGLRKTSLGILRALRAFLESHSRDEIPHALRSEATHYFGSLRHALVALKKDQRLLRGWSKPKIITVLSRMHRSKEPLAYAQARRNVPALVSAAEAYFGSWGKALYAAGIDPNLYFVHHKWRKPRVSVKPA